MKLVEYPVENKHALMLSDSVIEAMRQATIEMKDSKYLKDVEAGDKDGDDDEVDNDKELFKKRTHKNGNKKDVGERQRDNKFSNKFSGSKIKPGHSFARKRQRVN